MKISFLLICEGSSDRALVSHLRSLCVACGCDEATGTPIDLSTLPDPPGHRTLDKLRAALELEPEADIVFVYRDADGRELLLDETALRRVVGRPSGKAPLDLPPPSRIESQADPKCLLETLLIQASEARGRRRQQVKSQLPRYRRILLERLPVGGPLDRLDAWVALRDDAQQLVAPVPTRQESP